VTDVNTHELPDEDHPQRSARKTLAGSAFLYWLVATVVVSVLLCGIPLAVFAAVIGGADHRSVLASLIGAVGLVIVGLGILKPEWLGRAVVSSVHSIQLSRQRSEILVSIGMSIVVGAIGYWVTQSTRVLIAAFVAGVLLAWLRTWKGPRHAA